MKQDHPTMPRPDTGFTDTQVTTALLLAADAMLFAALFASFLLLRAVATPESWALGPASLGPAVALLGTAALVLAAGFAWSAHKQAGDHTTPRYLAAATVLGLTFLGLQGWQVQALRAEALLPSTNTFLASFTLLAGLQGLHVLGAVLATAFLARSREDPRLPGRLQALAFFWSFLALLALGLLAAFHLG